MLHRLEGWERWAIVILQVFPGFVFVMHGAQKLFGAFQGPGIALPNGFFWGKAGYEFPLTLGVMALLLVLTGPSFASVDRAIGLERRTT